MPRLRVPAALGLLAVLVGCGERPIPAAPAPVPSAAPTAVPIPSPSPTAPDRIESAVYEIAVPTPTPRPVPRADPPPEEPARRPPSRRDEIARCLLLQASVDPSVSFVSGRVRLEVRGKSTCGFAVLASETGFVVESFPLAGGGAVARENGAFQTDIEPGRTATTLIEVDCPGWRNCRYAARPAGAGAE